MTPKKKFSQRRKEKKDFLDQKRGNKETESPFLLEPGKLLLIAHKEGKGLSRKMSEELFEKNDL